MQIAAQPNRAMLGQPIQDPANWLPADLEEDDRWQHHLTQAETRDLVALGKKIAARVNGDPNGLLKLHRDDFDLGAFKPSLDALKAELSHGYGVSLVRGLPLDSLSRLEAAAIYWGIGAHLGKARSNNPEGDMIGHVTDLGKRQDDPQSRGYQTRETMDYHCDQASIVGLLCVQEPRSGGLSKIASSIAVYNALLQTSPETIDLLSKPFCWTKHGEVDDGLPAYYESPVFSILSGKLCVSFGPRHIIKGHALPGAPELTSEQRDAIKRTEDIAESLHYSMQLQKGDIQFLNNYVALHTRNEYIDWPEANRKRLLWRLWLSAPEIRPATEYVKQWDAGVTTQQTTPRIIL